MNRHSNARRGILDLSDAKSRIEKANEILDGISSKTSDNAKEQDDSTVTVSVLPAHASAREMMINSKDPAAEAIHLLYQACVESGNPESKAVAVGVAMGLSDLGLEIPK